MKNVLEKTLEEAYNYLRMKYKIKPLGDIIEKLEKSFLLSTKPDIKPYHIDTPHPLFSNILPKLKTPIFLESKYDGTHMLFCKNGIFKHNGDPITKDQLAGLLYIAHMEPNYMEPILKNIDDYTFAIEMFGSAYTPIGVHKNYPKPYTIVVFEVGERKAWIPPPRKYNILSNLGINYVKFEEQILITNYQSLIEYLEHKVDKFIGEGLVAKADIEEYLPISKYELQYIKPGGLFIFKYKKPQFKEARRKIEKEKKEIREIKERKLYEIPEDAKEEVLNELHKIAAEMGKEYLNVPKNIPLILNRVISHIMIDHPIIWEKCKNISERNLKKNVVALLIEVQKTI
ncbi:MAG: hypothetical protein QXM07_08195 [Nitrososphaerota archaeon]